MSRTTASILSTAVLASVGVLAFLIWGRQIRTGLDEGVFRLSYQLLLVLLVGGAVSLLYKQFSLEQDLAQKRPALLRPVHTELLTAFNNAKRGRRRLRAHVGYSFDRGFGSKSVQADEYEEQMDSVMEAQSTFEVYAKRAEDNQLWFSSGQELSTELRWIEGYLNSIIDEYEENLRSFSGTPPGARR